ncbi:MAG TPA: rhodanese-like domain-containing protein [Methylotenera sp.]|nr:rhodanese-like domain-containing protein [Methylotenera sp.]
MTNSNEILKLAQQRAIEKALPYTGALTPHEAFDLMQQDPATILVDVRSRAELELVGKIPQATHIEWAFYPGMVANTEFAKQLVETVDKSLTVVFMCRTGGRSHNAAVVANQLGFKNAYNMLEGFEGEANSLHQRTLINGWKHAGLPWSN